jgi:hypothetical protein
LRVLQPRQHFDLFDFELLDLVPGGDQVVLCLLGFAADFSELLRYARTLNLEFVPALDHD